MPADTAVPDQIIGEIGRIVTEVIGDDYTLDTEISASTAFIGDLELESIEFVSLASRLQDLYGPRVDFVSFVAELEMDEMTDLTVGELADFIAGCLLGGGDGGSRGRGGGAGAGAAESGRDG
jgi:acyl carrier protein